MSNSGDNNSTPLDSPSDREVEKVKVQQTEKVLDDKDLLNNAFAGENKEHEMGVWDAVRKHPWACLWAFTMCFTIVSYSCLLLLLSEVPDSMRNSSFTPDLGPGRGYLPSL